VGDLHGCFRELMALLESLAFGPDDLLLFVGDLLDRGPHSWELAGYFRDTTNAFCVLGNHERRVARVIRGQASAAWTQHQTLAAMPRAQWEPWATWLESLPAVIETPELILTHSRLDPQRSLNAQDPYHTCAVGGESVHIPKDGADIPLWYHAWKEAHPEDKRPIAFGHLAHQRVVLVPGGLYALDTGAVNGGLLSALVLPSGHMVDLGCPDYFSQALASWRSSQREAVSIRNRPISSFRNDGAEEDAGPDRELVTAFNKIWSELNPYGRFCRHREALLASHGSLPEHGAQRSRYYQTLRASLPPGLHVLFAKTLIHARLLPEPEFRSHLSSLSLEELDKNLTFLESRQLQQQ